MNLSAAGSVNAYVKVVANAHSALSAAVGSFSSATEKETVMQSMTFGSSSKWNVGSSFTPLPIWG
ncbi:MAG: hypothetical protein LBR26_17450 [Prevotella sp.]|nr:hypothetical protein [Prevotella sp.]